MARISDAQLQESLRCARLSEVDDALDEHSWYLIAILKELQTLRYLAHVQKPTNNIMESVAEMLEKNDSEAAAMGLRSVIKRNKEILAQWEQL